MTTTSLLDVSWCAAVLLAVIGLAAGGPGPDRASAQSTEELRQQAEQQVGQQLSDREIIR